MLVTSQHTAVGHAPWTQKLRRYRFNGDKAAGEAIETVVCSDAQPSSDRLDQQHPQQTVHATARCDSCARLMQTAVVAAGAGDCAAVKAVDEQIRDTDVDFHDTVFLHDAAIVRCLNSAEPTVKGP